MAQQFETLQCNLTPDEIRKLGQDLARTNQLVAEMREAKQVTVSNMTASIKTVERNAAVLTQKILSGKEERSVEVMTFLDTPKPGVKSIVRLDTNETVRVEGMTIEEQQQAFHFEKKQ
jgi:hypothetical protein